TLPFMRSMLIQRSFKESKLTLVESCRAAQANTLDRQPRAGLYGQFQRRGWKTVEQQPAQAVKAPIASSSKANQQFEFASKREIGAASVAVERVLKLGQGMLAELVLAQLQHRLDRRQNRVATSLREQGSVVTFRPVFIGCGKIQKFTAAGIEHSRPCEVIVRRDRLVRGITKRNVLGTIDDNDPASHGQDAFGSKVRVQVAPDWNAVEPG